MEVWCPSMDVQHKGGALMWRSKGHPLVEMDGDASAGDPCGGERDY